MLVVYESNRLEFGLLSLNDSQIFVSLCSQPGIGEFGSETYRSPNEQSAALFIQSQLRSFERNRSGKFVVSLKSNQLPIGIAGIFQMDEPLETEFEINYRFATRARGQGYGVEAAQAMIEYGKSQLGLARIYAAVSKSNFLSKKVLSRVGMLKTNLLPSDASEELWGIGH
jgi:RimJ/RimL family protein N-acetyltransferase